MWRIGDVGIVKRIAAIRGIGTGWNSVLWMAGLAGLLGGLLLECSEFSDTLWPIPFWVMTVVGFGVWLIRRMLEAEDGA